MSQPNLVVSFVHGYQDLDINIADELRPALWVEINGEKQIFSYPFPRNPEDFKEIGNLLVGESPLDGAPTFKKLPRYGLTGLAQSKEHVWAGAWNSIYKISKKDFSLSAIVSNRMMNDMHGIYADDECLINVLTCKDTVVINDHEGNIIDHFMVDTRLNVTKEDKLEEVDWRFVSKQFRGSTGYWHFNYVQKIDNEIWLTSRNCNSFVIVDLETKKARLKMMNLCTPALIHDGIKHGDKFYFTSIDGKVLVAEDHSTADFWTQEGAENMKLYNRDLASKLIRLSETELGKEPNWCRGIDVRDEKMYITVDGRYDTDLSFGLICLDGKDDNTLHFNKRIRWSEIGAEKDIRYVTGFDVIALD